MPLRYFILINEQTCIKQPQCSVVWGAKERRHRSLGVHCLVSDKHRCVQGCQGAGGGFYTSARADFREELILELSLENSTASSFGSKMELTVVSENKTTHTEWQHGALQTV